MDNKPNNMISSKFKDAKILIVDDQQFNIDILIELLEFHGYTHLLATTDSKEVTSLFSSFKPDLILLDLMMPDLDGFEILEQLKSMISSDTYLPILVLTADVERDAKEKALSGGAKDFLLKPFDMTEVALRIYNLLETRHLYLLQENQNQILEEEVKKRTSDLDKAIKELQKAKEKAETNDQLKTTFIQNISQEVRTPLNGVIGIAEMITDLTLSNEEKMKLIPMLRTSSKRLINTITDFVDISMIVSNQVKVNPKEIFVNKELSEITGNFSTECKGLQIELRTEMPINSDTFTVKTDIELFRKIISHLLRNAIKETTNGSITIGYTIGNRYAEFYVKDTSGGIHNEVQEKRLDHISPEDSTINNEYEGSGIGLSIIKGYLNLLKGNLSVNSIKGEGTTFYFTLPIGVENTIASKKEDRTEFPRNDRPVVLIVEDDETNRMFFSHVLKDYVSGIYLAENGKIAVELCQQHAEISFVLMDMKMPIMNGYDATREIKSFRKKLPIIAITAYAMTGDDKMAFEAGCDDYVTKPINRRELITKLKNKSLLLEEGRSL